MTRLLVLPELEALRSLTVDGWWLMLARVVRLFAYGLLSVIFALYLAEVGLRQQAIGLMLTLTLVGDAAISLGITTRADRLGRRRMLLVGAGLMVFGGLVCGLTSHVVLLGIAAFLGTLSPSGGEVGPFLSIEQAALPQTTSDAARTQVFAWYNLAGACAAALGALSCQLDTNIHLGRITAHNAVHRRQVAEMLKAPPQDFRAGAVAPPAPHKPAELGDPGDGLA